MNDDYLWDRSGTRDPEIEHLERLLGRYKSEAALSIAPRRSRARLWLAAAAVFVAMFLGAVAIRFHWPAGEPWDVIAISGTATVDGRLLRPDARLAPGDTLHTGPHTRVVVRVARVGVLEVGPQSEVTLVATSRSRHRVDLRHGTLAARVWAPPFTFGVTTPAGLASDLGCAFTLRYERDAGFLHVTSGWVDFDGAKRSVAVPAGAVVKLRPAVGPGTPYRADAPPELRDAVDAFDAGERDALARLLAIAGRRDAVTLMNLLENAHGASRGAVFDRLAAVAPPPPGVTRHGIVEERNAGMLRTWRNSLGLGSAKRWWLHWRDAFPR